MDILLALENAFNVKMKLKGAKTVKYYQVHQSAQSAMEI